MLTKPDRFFKTFTKLSTIKSLFCAPTAKNLTTAPAVMFPSIKKIKTLSTTMAG